MSQSDKSGPGVPASELTRSQRRWDQICIAVLALPLVVLAFQGDIMVGIAERIDYKGQYTRIHEREAELAKLRAEREAIPQRGALTIQQRLANRNQEAALRERETVLELEIKTLRSPSKEWAQRWNFSAAQLWPMSLLLGPLAVLLVWTWLDPKERRAMYEEALSSGARSRGLLLGLAAVAVFWLGGFLNGELARAYFEHRGGGSFVPPFYLRLGGFLSLVSYAGWSAAAVYAFGGRRGLRKLWVPLALVMAVAAINYGPAYRTRWVSLWDIHPQWGYGYFIGPIAAYLFVTLLAEKRDASLLPVSADGGWLFGSRPVLSPWRAQGAGGDRERLDRQWRHASRMLLGFGLVLALGAALGWAGLAAARVAMPQSGIVGGVLSLANRFAAFPLALGIALAALWLWQRGRRQERMELAMRLAGLAVVLIGLAARYQAEAQKIAYFSQITFIVVLFGAVLAVFGYGMMRVAWVPILFLALAIPWPERTYVAVAGIPQQWSAIIATRVMNLLGYTVVREGTKLIVGPLPTDVLHVAEECSGLKIMFSFVALGVVYAYINHRPAWRRGVILGASLPIAVISNFTRVFGMALLYRLGYKQFAEGLAHEMVGYLMLVEAFLLLWAVMRGLDLLEVVADRLATDGDGKKGSGGGTQGARA